MVVAVENTALGTHTWHQETDMAALQEWDSNSVPKGLYLQIWKAG